MNGRSLTYNIGLNPEERKSKTKSLFGQQKMITQFPSLNFHHSSLITHISSLITHHSFFHTICGPIPVSWYSYLFFLFSVPNSPKLIKKKKKKTKQPTQEKKKKKEQPTPTKKKKKKKTVQPTQEKKKKSQKVVKSCDCGSPMCV